MALHIRGDRAAKLARQLAERKGISMTDAVIAALEAALARGERPLPERLAEIAARGASEPAASATPTRFGVAHDLRR